MKKFLILSILLIIGTTMYSQKVLLMEDLDADTITKKWGKNLKHYGHLYMGLGFSASAAEKGAEVIYGASSNFDFGYRYKYKICNYYSIGADLNINTHIYRLKQDEETKIVPDNVEHDKERIQTTGLKLELYQRFNFGKRGNHIGNYFDIGAYGSYFLSTQHYTMDKNPGWNPDIGKIETVSSNLDYMEDFEYGLTTRLGFGRWVFFGKYRMSDLFVNTDNLQTPYPELPALNVGFEISLF